jgi:cytochrome P450
MSVADLPFLDLAAPGFSTRSPEVLGAREQSWCAKTPYGLAVLRHREAGLLLRDRRLRQGSHAWPTTIGISGTFADFWRRSIISLEGDDHRALRQIARQTLSDDYILSLVPDFNEIAEALLQDLTDLADFDFVDRFSEPFAGRAIATLLGRPAADAPTIGRDASTLGLAMGPDARNHEAKVNAACERLLVLADDLIAAPPKTGFMPRLLQAARDHDLQDRQALIDLIVISIFGGVDTTRAQLAFAIYLFAHHPEQWTWLRDTPGHVPQAIEEVIRTFPTTTWATREALEDFTIGDVEIKAGETLHIFVHATGTDPATGPFDGFDIRARRKIHFGFGGGGHHCLGQFVARTDMAAALSVLLKNWRSVALVGTPEFLPDSGNTSPRSLRIKPEWS